MSGRSFVQRAPFVAKGKRVSYVKKGRRNRRMIRSARKFKAKVMKVLENQLIEKNTYTNNTASRIAISSYGTQQIGEVCSQNSYPSLNKIYVSGLGATFGGIPALTSVPQKFTIAGYNMRLMIKNQAYESVILDLYCCVPRFDNTDNTCDPSAGSIAAGYNDQNNQITVTTLGATPFQSNKFCTMWKIVCRDRIVLNGGSTEIIEHRDKKRYLIDNERLQRQVSSIYNMRGINKKWFIVMYSPPVNDATTKTQVSTGLSAIDVVCIENYWYEYVVTNTRKDIGPTGLGTIAGVSSMIDNYMSAQTTDVIA